MDFVIDVLVHIKHLDWTAILVTLGGSGVVAAVTQWLKGKLNNKTKTKVLSIVGALAAFPDVLGQVVSNPGWAVYLPDNFAWVFTGAVALHALLTTPPFRKLQTVLRQYRQALDDVRAADSAPVSPISNPNNSLNKPLEAKPADSYNPVSDIIRG